MGSQRVGHNWATFTLMEDRNRLIQKRWGRFEHGKKSEKEESIRRKTCWSRKWRWLINFTWRVRRMESRAQMEGKPWEGGCQQCLFFNLKKTGKGKKSNVDANQCLAWMEESWRTHISQFQTYCQTIVIKSVWYWHFLHCRQIVDHWATTEARH